LTFRPVVLCVLDGWGIAPDGAGNAVTRAETPRLDGLFRRYAHARLDASGTAVGLPPGVMGNSEVGHLTMGAGYVQPQSLDVINDAVRSGAIFANEALRVACRAARDGAGTLHLIGLLSTGGVHADMKHLDALVELARRERVPRVAVHAILDGRDMPPRSALPLLERVGAPIATVHGRYYAMDRDRRWDRVERSWRAIVDADGPRVVRAEDALRRCYEDPACRDELLEPHVVGEGAPVQDGDAIVSFNFRPDRARQLTSSFMRPAFDEFPRARVPRGLTFVTFTDYQLGLEGVRMAFAGTEVVPIAHVLSEGGLHQFHVAETEKYAHVTYFFNGGREEAYSGEERVLVPSPRVATYDLAPEMSAAGVAAAFEDAVGSGRYDFAIVNFANPDMVGHTGVIEAALRAMAATDTAVGRVVDATLGLGGAVLVTADHGNAEEMLFPDGTMNTQHSVNPVPVVLAAPDGGRGALRDGGLRDIAPTLLALLGLPPVPRMTGQDLLVR
jgi:2,3-bisphosphoglycerate-independent phosphoglycerate mutase